MVHLNKHDLEFILKQIRIAEAHSAAIANGEDPAVALARIVNAVGAPNGVGNGVTQASLVPYGLRTVDGSYNNFTPNRVDFGSSDQIMDRLLDPVFRPAENGTSYQQPVGLVMDSQPRVISNLVADQTLNNPAAIAAALMINGMEGQALYDAVGEIRQAYLDLEASNTPENAAALGALLGVYDVKMDGINVVVTNVSADLGDTAPFNSFFTIFGQFFDHGLDLTQKGGSGTVMIALHPDDPLYNPNSPTNFMMLSRATNQPGADGILGTADDIRENANETTPWIDLNQVYTSNASHQVFLREYAMHNGKPVSTGHMLEGATDGPPAWADVKSQALTMLGIELTDAEVLKVPLLLTDLYGEFVRGANGYPMVMVAVSITPAGGGTPVRSVFAVEGRAGGFHPSDLTAADLPAGTTVPPGATVSFGFASAGRAFLNDIAHAAAPVFANGQLAPDADSLTGNAPATGTYDNELLDRHYIVGDGRGNRTHGFVQVSTAVLRAPRPGAQRAVGAAHERPAESLFLSGEQCRVVGQVERRREEVLRRRVLLQPPHKVTDGDIELIGAHHGHIEQHLADLGGHGLHLPLRHAEQHLELDARGPWA